MTPIQTLYDCIKYCEEQNGMSLCKNCGLDKEMIDQALAEAYRNGETAGLAGKEENK